jgi:shikimate kinase
MTGAGKSLYGRKTAEHYGMKFTDTDEDIIKRTGMEITAIFRSEGEEYFRKIEEEVISDAVGYESSVISVGAGALKSDLNRKNLSENCFCVLLDAENEDIISGLTDQEIQKRPVLHGSDLKAALDRMFSERREDYFAVSDLIVRTRKKTIEEDLKKIIRELDVR